MSQMIINKIIHMRININNQMREQYLEWYYLLCLRIKSLGLPYNDSAPATSCWTLGGLELPLKLYPSGNDKIDKISIVSLTQL